MNDTAPTCTHCKCALIFDSRSPTCERWVCSCGYFAMRAIEVKTSPVWTTVIGADYGLEPSVSTVAYYCARCSLTFTGESSSHVNTQLAVHQERCIIAGDDIRWYPDGSDDEGNLIDVGRSLDGVVIDNGRTFLRVTAVAGDFRLPSTMLGRMRPSAGDIVDWSISPGTIRRIPRPGQEWRQVFQNGADRSLPCSTCSKMFRDHHGVACEMPRLEDYQKPGETLSKAEIDAKRPGQEVTRDSTSGMVTPETPEQWAEVMRRAGVAIGPPTGTVTQQPPAPTLYDSIDARTCLYQWWDNRSCLENGTAILYDMTPSQIAVAKAGNARLALHDSAQLRALTAAPRSAERNQVVLDDDEALLAGCRSVE